MKRTKIKFDEYQKKAFTTACSSAINSTYMVAGLAGEAGEVAGRYAKIIRDGDSAEQRQLLRKELGDVLWFIAGTATLYGWSLDDIAQDNLAKLFDRKARGVIQGNGDER